MRVVDEREPLTEEDLSGDRVRERAKLVLEDLGEDGRAGKRGCEPVDAPRGVARP